MITSYMHILYLMWTEVNSSSDNVVIGTDIIILYVQYHSSVFKDEAQLSQTVRDPVWHSLRSMLTLHAI